MTASSSSSTPSLERVIGEAFVVASKIILESRIYSPRSKHAQTEAKARAWVSTNAPRLPTLPHVPHPASCPPPQFNLEVEEVEGATKALERWRRDTGLPLVLEVRTGLALRPDCTWEGAPRRVCGVPSPSAPRPISATPLSSTCRSSSSLGAPRTARSSNEVRLRGCGLATQPTHKMLALRVGPVPLPLHSLAGAASADFAATAAQHPAAPFPCPAALLRAVETLLERWVVHYHPQLPEGPSHLSRSQLSRLNPASVYKRLVITLRSLYTYVRLLPAYRMYRACKVS